VLVLLAWAWLWRGAGLGISALDMTRVALFPHRLGEVMPGMEAPPFHWILAIAMWWIMMIAMMIPGSAPLLLLYGRVVRQAVAQGHAPDTYVGTAFLVAGYLVAWLGFSVLAALLQSLLQRAAMIEPMMLWSNSAPLSATVLMAAGVYQLSPLKQRCLTQCRGPAQFLMRHWRPGRMGAMRIGIVHGAWCVGCCWALMALLFVGGVMNLVWIAALAVMVSAEKLLPGGALVGRVAGVLLVLWGVASLFA
jgi:predicted metal-binding membrane protein